MSIAKKAPEMLKEIGANQELIHAICNHGYGICSDIEKNIKWKNII